MKDVRAGYESFFFADPDALEVPLQFDVPPLPTLMEPEFLPRVPVPAAADDEALVELHHERLLVLSTYHQPGSVFCPQESSPRAFLRRDAAKRLCVAADGLPDGFGLAVFDAWRPPELQRALYEAAYADLTLPAGFVTEPSDDPALPPPHVTGGAIDMTLTWDGAPLELGTAFDDFTARARTDAYEHEPSRVRELRRLLYHTMREAGFVVLDCEWWHYEFGTRRWAALTGQTPRYGTATLAGFP
jgi:D-alanyl-D-alanine dipeptidase